MSPADSNLADFNLHPCEWRLTEPRLYSRAQDTRERLVLRQVHGLPGRINYYMVACIQLRYDFADAEAETRARNAWIALRCSHPSIAIRFDDNSVTFSPLEPDRASVDAWIADSFFLHRTNNTALSVSATIRPSPGMQLHFLPGSKEMLLAASHEHTDGHGLVMLLDVLCRIMAFPTEPCFANQQDRLSPPLDVATKIEAAPTDVWKRTERSLHEWKEHASHPMCVGMSPDLPGPGAWEMGTTRLILSCQESLAIFTFAKSHKVSVNDLMNGAVIMAAKQHGRFQEGNWAGGVLLDARNVCKHPFNTPEHAAALYFAAYPAWVQAPASILDAAAQIQKQRLAFQSDATSALQTLQPMLHFSTRVSGVEDRRRPSAASSSWTGRVEYSGLGKLDGMLRQVQGDMEIVDFWLSVGHCTAAIGVYCYAYCGRLGFTVSYNPGLHSKTSIASFGQTLRSLLGGLVA